MRVLVCEPNIPEQYLHYASLAARAARDVTTDVVLGLASETIGTPWYDRFIRPLDGRVTIRAQFDAPRRRSESSVSARVFNRIAHWAFLQRYLRDLKPDYVILPSADRVVNTLALLPKAFSEGADVEVVLHTSIVGRAGGPPSLEGRLRRILIPRAPAVARFHFTDWTQYAEARQRYPMLTRKFRFLPNPIEIFDLLPRDDARRVLALPVQGRIAAVLSPDPFTELQPLLELFASQRVPADWRLLIVGPMHPSVSEFLDGQLRAQQRDGHVVLLKDRTEDIDVHRAISAADLVIGRLAPVAGVSATCLRVAVAGRRFFAASSPWVDMMAALGFGDSFSDTARETFETRFRRALEHSRDPINPEVVRRMRKFHSAEHFMEAISDRLRIRTGLKAGAGLTWDWVREAADGHPSRSSSVA